MGMKVRLFVLRWVMCSLGLWISVRLFGHEDGSDTLSMVIATFLLAGLIFSLINAWVKPIITILSLPFVLVTLGLFMLFINGFLVWLTIELAPNLTMTFSGAIISGIVMSLVNYVLSGTKESSRKEN
jgi:putative membrane protein